MANSTGCHGLVPGTVVAQLSRLEHDFRVVLLTNTCTGIGVIVRSTVLRVQIFYWRAWRLQYYSTVLDLACRTPPVQNIFRQTISLLVLPSAPTQYLLRK